MAAWPPKIGSKWRDNRLDHFTYEVLSREDRHLTVTSRWKLKNGGRTHYTRVMRRIDWERWDGTEVPAF